MKDHSPAFYRTIDYMGAIIIGASSTLIPYFLVPNGWGMYIGMLVGMLLAMVATAVISIAFSSFAAFEVAMPGMTTSMILGMISFRAIDSTAIVAAIGICFGFCVQFAFHIYDASLRGEVKHK